MPENTTSPNLQAVWKTKLSVAIEPPVGMETEGEPYYAELCAGIENLEEAINEQTKQYFFMCGEGFAHNEVNGMAPTFTLSGRRVHGDAAQDYIDAQKYLPAEARKTRIKLESTYLDADGKTAKTTTITCAATMTAIHTLGGATTDNSPFNVTFSLNGKPTVATA